jgi:hypothetical protein
MVFWLLAVVVVIVASGLAWWWSGRAKPIERRGERTLSGAENDHIARSKGGGFSGM